MLSEVLTSNTRAELMRILFNGFNEEHYLRDLERLSNIRANSLQKEIRHLCTLDLLKSRKDGNRIYYFANTEHPLYPELVSMVEKTSGVFTQLKTRLEDPRIKCAFVFGSFAKGKENANSDVDLFVIGTVGMRETTKLLSGLQEKIGREINPHVFTPNEFKKRIKDKEHFVSSVLKDDIRPLIGDLNEYK